MSVHTAYKHDDVHTHIFDLNLIRSQYLVLMFRHLYRQVDRWLMGSINPDPIVLASFSSRMEATGWKVRSYNSLYQIVDYISYIV